MLLGRTALAEPLTDSDKSAATALFTKTCVARYKLGYDLKGTVYDPPFTEQEISNYCECTSSSLADLLTEEEWAALMLLKDKGIYPSKTVDESLKEKGQCIGVSKCKKHLNLAYPEKFQYEQCWKG
jgi:hypothetical protein